MNESKASRYQRLRRRGQIAGTLAGGTPLALVALTPLSRMLAEWAFDLGAGLPVSLRAATGAAGIVVVLLAAWEIAALPAVISLARRDRRFLSAADSPEDAVLAQAQATLVALPVALAGSWIWLASAAIGGAGWWVFTGLGLAGLLGLALRGAPQLLGRLAETVPMSDRALASRLADLASRAGVTLGGGILEWRVDPRSQRSALVAGVGQGRRVLIASDLARHWSHDEIAVVVAHELAHHRHRDLWRTLALDAALLVVAAGFADVVLRWWGPALGFSGPGDLAAAPLLILAGGAAWLAATPLRHALSRGQERRADAVALALTGGVDAFSAAIRRLGDARLAEEQPSAITRWLFHRHPSMAERLAFAETRRGHVGDT